MRRRDVAIMEYTHWKVAEGDGELAIDSVYYFVYIFILWKERWKPTIFSYNQIITSQPKKLLSFINFFVEVFFF